MNEPTITEQMEVEERFMRDQVFPKLSNAILIVELREGIAYVERCNEPAMVFFGCGRKDIVDNPLENRIPERYRAEHAKNVLRFFKVLDTRGMGYSLDIFALTARGEVPVLIYLTPIVHENKGTMVMAEIRDKTVDERTA
jgi:hypothetical protein